MLSFMGGLLLCGGCAYAGIHAALILKKRASILAGLVSMLELMSAEISFRLTPLPELMDILAANFPAFKESVWLCADKIRQGQSVSSVWAEAWETYPLQKAEKKAWQELGAVLGQYDAQRQAEALAYTRGRMERFYQKAERAYASQGRLYSILGIACGIIMTVLLA